MSKRRSNTKKQQPEQTHSQDPRVLYVAVVLALVLIVGLVGAFIASQNSSATTDTAATTADEPAVQLISPGEYQSEFVASSADHLLIDVRTPGEFASGHIAGAVNIPVESLARRLSEVPEGQNVVVYCRSGNRSAEASRILESAGYDSIYDLGGIITWTAQGFPVE